MWWWRDVRDGLDLGFTDRAGGVSEGPYAGLNLGAHVEDDPAAVAANRSRLADGLDLPVERLALMRQVHGRQVAVVTGDEGAPPTADAMVTTATGLALTVLVADCTPVLLSDLGAGVLAVLHCGRPGLLAGVVPATLDVMRDLGARSIAAVVGPSVCGRCYEVPAAMRDEVSAAAPASRARTWQGTPALDVATGVVEQLAAGSVAVQWVPGCTREAPGLFSYRRDGRTGRFAGVAVLR